MVLGHIIVFSPADFRWTSWAWKCSQVHLWNGCHDRCRWVRIIILRFTSYTYWISYARTLGWKRKMWRHFFNGFYFKTQKSPFLEVKSIFFNNFFSVLAFKTIHTQMLFWSVFLKMHKKTVINRQKRQKNEHLGPLEFFEKEPFFARTELLDLDFYNHTCCGVEI